MNLKETIISSFFFHLILFLLVAAVSSYTTGLPGGLQDIVSVDLTMENSRDLPAPAISPAVKPPWPSPPLSKEEPRLPEKAENSPPEESKKTEPEKKAEATADSATIEKHENPPAQKEGIASLEAYYQFIILHRKIFGQQAGARVNELIGEALKWNTREFYGGTASVTLTFGPDGKLSKVLVDSVSPELKAFLEEIDWIAVPTPPAYLKSNGVQIEFAVLEGYLSFKINAL